MKGELSKASLLNVDSALGHDIVDRRLQILSQVSVLGSISGAARQVGVSYKAAWQALDTLSNLAGCAVVQANPGGSGGGGARLTSAGEALLQIHETLQSVRKNVLQALLQQGDQVTKNAMNLAIAQSPAMLGWRTSMRNLLPAEVVEVRESSSICTVRLCLPDAQIFEATITALSAQLLGLTVGMAVIAMFKATAVRVAVLDAVTLDAQSSGTRDLNRLFGNAVVTGSEADDSAAGEVTFELGTGQRVVGIRDPADDQLAHSWSSGQRVVGAFDASSVVLMLPA